MEARELEPVSFGIEGMKTPLELREKIDQLEDLMLEEPQIEIPTVHRFADGLYAREVTIPKGALVTGKIHKTEHINVVSKGDISVLTPEGMKRIKAPCTFVAPAGTKRVGFAHEETVWTTFHATEETDLDRLEADLIEPKKPKLTEQELKQLEGSVVCLG